MASPLSTRYKSPRQEPASLLLPIAVLWGIVCLAVVVFLWIDNDLGRSLEGLYLVPWLVLLGLVVSAPSVYLYLKGRFDLFHPLVFAAWSYILPAFVIGGSLIAFGLFTPAYSTFIEDQRFNYPYTAALIALGFLGLTIGYFLPLGKKISSVLEPRLPSWQWRPEQVWLPGVLLVICGLGLNILGLVQGVLGFQRNVEVNVYDGTLFFFLVILTEGIVLLWLAIFSTKFRTGTWYIILTALVIFIPIRVALAGNRGGLFASLMPIAFAFVFSGRKLKGKMLAVFLVAGILATFIGAMYGTTFRNIKGSESRVGAGDYIGQVGATLEYIGTTDSGRLFSQTLSALAERVENFSSVAIVVSRHETLAPYEASYGLENNIINDAFTSFIPRFLWADKPPTSDPRAYSDLYFNYSENSFAISPFADLLRNFGPVGVPLGMMLLGIYLRTLYALLIETPQPAMWKKVSYFLLLTVVSYEGFFATILPTTIRYIVVLAISLFVANLFVGKIRRTVSPARAG